MTNVVLGGNVKIPESSGGGAFCGTNERAAFFNTDFSKGCQPSLEVSTTSEKCLEADIDEQYEISQNSTYPVV